MSQAALWVPEGSDLGHRWQGPLQRLQVLLDQGLILQQELRALLQHLAPHLEDINGLLGCSRLKLMELEWDPESEGEFRFLSVGLSSGGHLLVVAYTERGERIRIIVHDLEGYWEK